MDISIKKNTTYPYLQLCTTTFLNDDIVSVFLISDFK